MVLSRPPRQQTTMQCRQTSSYPPMEKVHRGKEREAGGRVGVLGQVVGGSMHESASRYMNVNV